MPLVSLKCPNCGAAMNVDDAKEFIFCEFCGTKIMVKEEVQKVEVTRNTDNERDNFLALAESDYNAGNFQSAYNYYTKALECDRTLWRAKLLRGICAASVVGDDGFRSREIIGGLKEVRADETLTDENRIEVFNLIAKFVDMAMNTAIALKGKNNILANAPSAKAYFDMLYCGGEIAVLLTEYVDASFVEKRPEMEEPRRAFITKALECCRLAQKPVVYHVGTKNVKKGDRVIEQDVNDKMHTPDNGELVKNIEKLVAAYNASPTTVATVKDFDFDIDKCQVIIDDYNSALADFFKERPDLKKTYEHPGLFGAKKKIAAVEAQFPETLLAKKAAWAQAGKEKAELVSKKAAFVKQNIIK